MLANAFLVHFLDQLRLLRILLVDHEPPLHILQLGLSHTQLILSLGLLAVQIGQLGLEDTVLLLQSLKIEHFGSLLRTLDDLGQLLDALFGFLELTTLP